MNVGGGTGSEVNLLLLAHALEKGMGLPNPRSKFGLEKAGKLIDLLESSCSCQELMNCYAFIEALSVLNAYLKFTDNECSEYRKRCSKLNDKVQRFIPAGTFNISDMEQIYEGIDLEKIIYFISSRHSIRSFKSDPVDLNTVKEVVKLAQNAPSACNRQPSKVYVTNALDRVEIIDSLIPGNKGFEGAIHNWAIITSDRNMFGNSEPLQWYVNGGIFLAYFVEALHAYKLGSCIFQIPGIHDSVPKLHEIACIPSNEAIIAAVGFGFPESPNKFIAATRRTPDDVIVTF